MCTRKIMEKLVLTTDINTKHVKIKILKMQKKKKSTSGEIKNETAIEYLMKRMYAEVMKKGTVKRFDK